MFDKWRRRSPGPETPKRSQMYNRLDRLIKMHAYAEIVFRDSHSELDHLWSIMALSDRSEVEGLDRKELREAHRRASENMQLAMRLIPILEREIRAYREGDRWPTRGSSR